MGYLLGAILLSMFALMLYTSGPAIQKQGGWFGMIRADDDRTPALLARVGAVLLGLAALYLVVRAVVAFLA